MTSQPANPADNRGSSDEPSGLLFGPADVQTDDWTAELESIRRRKSSDLSSRLLSSPAGRHNDMPWFDPDSGDSVAVANSSTNLDHSRSLRSKLVLALALMLGVVVGIDEIVRQQVIAPEFANLERVSALKDSNRVISAINTEVDFIAEIGTVDADRLGLKLAQDDLLVTANELVGAAKHEYREFGGHIHWAAIVDEQGNWSWLAKKTADPTALEFPGVLDEISDAEATGRQKINGIARGRNGDLHMFAAIPLKRLAVAKDWRGVYVVGRQLDQSLISELQGRTSVPFSVESKIEGGAVQNRVEFIERDDHTLEVKSPLIDARGQTLARINVELPRGVTAGSKRTTAFARYLSLCGACASLLLLLLLLQRIVVGRLEQIREHTEKIAQTGIIAEESSIPVLRVAGRDEIGQLAQSFDRMRVRLGDAQQRLADASHAAGMSLVADSVIHNVGNVLTNVNSLVETASRRVDRLRIEPLQKLARRLRDENVDEAMIQATPDYLQRLSETLEDDKDELTNLLLTLHDNVQHIHQVVRDQRRHANRPVKWVQVNVRSMIDEAVKFSEARLSKDNINVVVNCQGEPGNVRVWTDRSMLLQVIINIVGNAGQATSAITDRARLVEIDLIQTKSSVHIRFRDNGYGMDAETLSQIFDAHFTTRRSGSGLGLHFCAIAIKRIGGTIRAESDGPDLGATFVVELPMKKPLRETFTEHLVTTAVESADRDIRLRKHIGIEEGYDD